MQGQETYCRFFTESLEDLLNYAYHRKAMKAKDTKEQDFHGDTAPMSAEALNKVGTAYKVYSAVYPGAPRLDHARPPDPVLRGVHDGGLGKEGRLTCAASSGRSDPDPSPRPRSRRMCDAIRHRGPDDWGTFVEGGVGLGMRRLSIIDLAGGHQPITNEDGSVLVVFNGEIYNHEALRRELRVARDISFRTRSDTEVLVHLYEDHGERMLERLRGMFAFAIWDRRRRRLLLARDHFGQKPLFYTEQGGRLTFASEIKALLAHDPSLARLSPFALDQYLTLRFVQAPDTFFERHPRAPAGALPGLGGRHRPGPSATGT